MKINLICYFVITFFIFFGCAFAIEPFDNNEINSLTFNFIDEDMDDGEIGGNITLDISGVVRTRNIAKYSIYCSDKPPQKGVKFAEVSPNSDYSFLYAVPHNSTIPFGCRYLTLYLKGRNGAEVFSGKALIFYDLFTAELVVETPPAKQEDITITETTPIIQKNQIDIDKKVTALPAEFHYGNYHAIVIGNNNYQNIHPLKTAIQDAKAVSSLLKSKYNFNIVLLIDATRVDILKALNGARRKLTNNDNLLIYYAGHGWLDKEADQGYWIPVDGEEDSNINWIANSTITGTVRAISAKHVMLVVDSCYSGKLTRGINLTIKTPDSLSRLANKKARTVLTSGGLEPVLDSGGGNHSVFAKAFIDVLEENQAILDGHKLFSLIRRPIMLESDQTPEYSDIRKAGHDGGDFLFVKR